MEPRVRSECGVDLTNLASWEMGKLCLCIDELVYLFIFYKLT